MFGNTRSCGKDWCEGGKCRFRYLLELLLRLSGSGRSSKGGRRAYGKYQDRIVATSRAFLLVIRDRSRIFFQPGPRNRTQSWLSARLTVCRKSPLAEECRVRLGIENVWNKFLLSPVEMREFLSLLRAPLWERMWMSATCSHMGTGWLRILGQHADWEIHLKDFRRAGDGGRFCSAPAGGDVNWPDVRPFATSSTMGPMSRK